VDNKSELLHAPETLIPEGLDLSHLPSEDTKPPQGYKRIQMTYGVRTSDDAQSVEIHFNAPVSRMILTRREARAFAGMLKRAAIACVHVKESTPPPIRSTEYMDPKEIKDD
jgi:hypothetical protein